MIDWGFLHVKKRTENNTSAGKGRKPQCAYKSLSPLEKQKDKKKQDSGKN